MHTRVELSDTPCSKLPERPYKLLDRSQTLSPRGLVETLLSSVGGVGVASPFVVHEPVEAVSAAAVEREPGSSPGESR